jgi:ribose 5-phosphate isomerase B
MKIYLAADHAGFEFKNAIREHLYHNDYDVVDLGPEVLDPDDDYPEYAYDVSTKVLGGDDDDRGILLCGSGQGMCIAANRIGGIRASVIWSVEGAKETRQDNDSNVLCLPARMVDEETLFAIVDAWLETKFSNAERHKRRIIQLDELEA